MLYQLNKMLSRIFFKLILLCLLLTFFNQLFFKSATFIALIQPAFIILVVIWTSIPLAISSVILWPKACKYFKMKAWRIVVEIRKYYSLSPINYFILYVGALSFMVAVLSQFLFGNKFFILTGFSIVTMSVSFSIDLYNRTIYILKKVWSGMLGKILISLMATLSYIITNYLSRHWLYVTTDLEPRFFSEFINIVSIFLTPLSYLIILGFLSLFIVIPEFIGITFLFLFTPIRENFLRNRLKPLTELSVRMRTGKRIERLTPSELVLLNSKVMFFRTFSSPVFVCLIFYLFSWVSSITGGNMDTIARAGLVSYYYHSSKIDDVSRIKYYNYDNEKFSTAIFNGEKWEFFTFNDK